MTFLDTLIAAVTPTEDSEKNREARAGMHAIAGSTGWLAMVLEHHIRIEAAFAAVQSARSARSRKLAMTWLATILTGHATAEEAVLYPAMANTDQQSHATETYAAQGETKIQLAALDDLDPMSRIYLDKLEHLRLDVARHFGVEEGDYFPKLKRTADSALNGRLTRLYREAFERYMGDDREHRPDA